MSKLTHKNVHNYFKLNGYHLNGKDLCRVGYSFIKEGDIYEQAIGEFLLDWFDDKEYIEMTTSGTTGLPKLVRLEKQAMIQSALATGDFFGLQPGDKALLCLPTQFIAGKMMLVRSLILGLDIDVVSPSTEPLALNKTQYDFVAMVPLQVQNSIDKLKNVKKLIIGGAKIDSALEEKLLPLKTEIYETYGMTETITHIAAKRVGEKAFSVLPNVKIAKDDRDCLVIYVSSISDEPIVTNDLVELIDENQFVFLGRIDNVVNSGGVKLIPEQIEAKLVDKISNRFFVTGVHDSVLGEKLILVIEGEKQDFAPDFFDVLGKYEKPKEIVFVPKFKENENGKLLRKPSLV
ncbi:AMP-binding protein [Flavobacterium hibernum]|uniref:O-succinylbenzoic acid--CoA ligase n=1 Tax=Flavobacterium hibernum TaxID=37752 RepID=A0A0D0EN52_9FLAO|nr:AMP-binding protein [Flavobacterium hibernum]KIO54325.1 O-succinylbenzoic acid--CoA ligase [Flavobacterium hibernum]OXA88210.1 O-succinylbenzoic acid--CoA ligase [Flavobacterium hibernum]STO10838.1 2-succinylbenzoate--CoA ligase [Flavobacterium hibernum]